MLTETSINVFYLDGNDTEYLCTEEVIPCCSMKYYKLLEFGTNNVYPYSSAGIRLDHKLKPVLDSKLNLIGEL